MLPGHQAVEEERAEIVVVVVVVMVEEENGAFLTHSHFLVDQTLRNAEEAKKKVDRRRQSEMEWRVTRMTEFAGGETGAGNGNGNGDEGREE
jgi:hypothetical protein